MSIVVRSGGWVAIAVATALLACTSHPEPAMPDRPVQAPWSVSYHDGSNNGFRFSCDAPGADARFEYAPVTPENSSSGSYSGGAPASGALAPDRVAELWRQVDQLEGDRSNRATTRKMGTGRFVIRDGRGERSFLVDDGPGLRQFERFAAEFRNVPAH